MNDIGIQLKQKRCERKLSMRDVAAITGIDPALISKMEGGDRLPTEKQIATLAELYQLNMRKIRVYWLAERLFRQLEGEAGALEALTIARNRIEHLFKEQVVNAPGLTAEIKEKIAKVDFTRQLLEKKPLLEKEQYERRDDEFILEFIHESNRLADGQLNLQETKAILQKGFVAPGKSLEEHLAVVNHQDAILYLKDLIEQDKDLDVSTLLHLHGILFRGIDRENAGNYRQDTPTNKDRNYQLPSHQKVEKLLQKYVNFYHEQEGRLHPVLLAAMMHQRLLKIHPFADGNGRMARLIMNYIMLRNGYTIVTIKGDSFSRQLYENALEKSHLDHESDAFFHMITDAVVESLRNYLEWRPALY